MSYVAWSVCLSVSVRVGHTGELLLWDDVPGFLFRSILFFLSVHLSCFSRVVAACDAYAPVARLDCQTDHVVLLSRTQLSYAHARSTGSCANAREFSCDYSFDKRVNKTFLRVKIRFRVFFYSRSTICCCGR